MLMSTQFWLAYTRAFAYAYAYTVSENQAGLTPAAHYSFRIQLPKNCPQIKN